VSKFTDQVFNVAPTFGKGLITGEPHAAMRRSWADIHLIAQRIAGSLAKAGVVHGTRVAILVGDPADIAPLVQAIWLRAGTVIILHQPTARADRAMWVGDTAAVLEMIGARIVVVGEPFAPVMMPILRERGLCVLNVKSLGNAQAIEEIGSLEEDIALLQLTSGSTGVPKAVAVTHANLKAHCAAATSEVELSPSRDVMINWLPLFHDMGFVGFMISSMWAGVEAVCVTPSDFLKQPLLWPMLITKYRGTFTAGPNFAYSLLSRRLAQAPDGEFDLSTLRVALNGAEPVDIDTISEFLDAGRRFGLQETALTAGYGMAEATAAVSFTRLREPIAVDTVDMQDLELKKLASPAAGNGSRALVRLGPPLYGTEVRVVDEALRALPARSVGEIEIRGESVAQKYVTTVGECPALGVDGWLATGDLGYLTETNEVVVCGRKKDMIIVSGRNISPTDIERVATRVDGIRPGNAVAVRLSSPGRREEFAVAVETHAYDDPAEAARIRREVSNLVYDEIGVGPRVVVVTRRGTLPKTPSGKLRRSEALALVERELDVLTEPRASSAQR
jgi:fatty-acyl-CoA synthase